MNSKMTMNDLLKKNGVRVVSTNADSRVVAIDINQFTSEELQLMFSVIEKDTPDATTGKVMHTEEELEDLKKAKRLHDDDLYESPQPTLRQIFSPYESCGGYTLGSYIYKQAHLFANDDHRSLPEIRRTSAEGTECCLTLQEIAEIMSCREECTIRLPEGSDRQRVLAQWLFENYPQQIFKQNRKVCINWNLNLLTVLCKVFRLIEEKLGMTTYEQTWYKEYRGHKSRDIRNHVAEHGWFDIQDYCKNAGERRTGAENIVDMLMCSSLGAMIILIDALLDLSNNSLEGMKKLLLELYIPNQPEEITELFWITLLQVYNAYAENLAFKKVDYSVCTWTSIALPPSHRFSNTTESKSEIFPVEFVFSFKESIEKWTERLGRVVKDELKPRSVEYSKKCTEIKEAKEAKVRARLIEESNEKARLKLLKEEEDRKKAIADLDSWIDAPEKKTLLERVEPRPPKLIKNSKGLPKDNGAECKRWDALYAKTHEQNGKPKKTKK